MGRAGSNSGGGGSRSGGGSGGSRSRGGSSGGYSYSGGSNRSDRYEPYYPQADKISIPICIFLILVELVFLLGVLKLMGDDTVPIEYCYIGIIVIIILIFLQVGNIIWTIYHLQKGTIFYQPKSKYNLSPSQAFVALTKFLLFIGVIIGGLYILMSFGEFVFILGIIGIVIGTPIIALVLKFKNKQN